MNLYTFVITSVREGYYTLTRLTVRGVVQVVLEESLVERMF